jgi:hypothetical protein
LPRKTSPERLSRYRIDVPARLGTQDHYREVIALANVDCDAVAAHAISEQGSD